MNYTIILPSEKDIGTDELLGQIDKVKTDLANLEELVKLIKERETKRLGMHWVKGKD